MTLDSIITQVSVLFILLLIGFILKKINIMTDELGKGLATLIIYVTLPSLIITSMNYKYSEEMFGNTIKIFIIGFLIYSVAIIIALIFTKAFKINNPQSGVYKMLIIFANVGFMGYPVVEVVFGKVGVFYAAFFNLWFNILLWTLGVLFVSSDNKKINLKSIVNPGSVAIILGFTLFIFSIKLPDVLYIPLRKLGDSTTPMSMLVVGSMLGDAKFKEVFMNYKLFVVGFLRLIFIPTLLMIVMSKLNLPSIVKGVPIIIMCMPSAANAAIFSRKFDSDYRLASQGVFLTTLFSIFTIPLIISLMYKLNIL